MRKKIRRNWLVEISESNSPKKVKSLAVKKLITAALDQVEKKLPKSASTLSVHFTNDRNIRKLNKAYRNKDKATDVLSFSYFENKRNKVPSPIFGEIIISLQTAKRQAKDFGNTFEREILRLLIHGILHVAGYDHEKVPKKTVLQMQRKEDKLFSLLAKKTRNILR